MSQRLPHFATISYAFRNRFTAEVIEGVSGGYWRSLPVQDPALQ